MCHDRPGARVSLPGAPGRTGVRGLPRGDGGPPPGGGHTGPPRPRTGPGTPEKRRRGPVSRAHDAGKAASGKAASAKTAPKAHSQSCSRAYRAASCRVRVWVFCIALER